MSIINGAIVIMTRPNGATTSLHVCTLHQFVLRPRNYFWKPNKNTAHQHPLLPNPTESKHNQNRTVVIDLNLLEAIGLYTFRLKLFHWAFHWAEDCDFESL